MFLCISAYRISRICSDPKFYGLLTINQFFLVALSSYFIEFCPELFPYTFLSLLTLKFWYELFMK